MSYLSGFMMGTAIGKSIRQMLGGAAPAQGFLHRAGTVRQVRRSAPHSALQVVSSLPGRRRYRAALSEELAALLMAHLAKLDFLKEVHVSASTGSILLVFSEAHTARVDALAEWLRTRIFAHPAEATEARRAVLREADEPHAGDLTRSIHRTARAFSACINRLTGGLFDMSSFASFILVLRGLRKLVLTKASPSGAQMLWWALSLMRGWRTV